MPFLFDPEAFDSDAFDCGVEVPAIVPPDVVRGLNESVPSDGGFLVHKDLAEIRGKFIYRNAPPDQSAFISVRGLGLRAELGDVKAVGVVDMTDEELVAFLLLANEEAEAEEVAEAAKLAAEFAVRDQVEQQVREELADPESALRGAIQRASERAYDLQTAFAITEVLKQLTESGIDCSNVNIVWHDDKETVPQGIRT